MKLYLVQHGQAKTKEEDPSRPLTDEGKELSEKTACFAAEQAQVSVGAVFHSDKSRAKETAEIMAAYLCPVRGIKEEKDLSPNEDPKIWEARLAEMTEDVMLVGHLPHLSRLASVLLGDNDERPVVSFKNSGIVCLKRDDAGKWLISWFVTPDILGRV